MLLILGFVACESKSHYNTIFFTSLIKKCLFCGISYLSTFKCWIMVLISICHHNIFKFKQTLCIPPFPQGVGEGGSMGGLSFLLNIQKGGAWQDLRGRLLGKIGVTFSGRGLQFLHKKNWNKKQRINWNLKYLMTKKVYKQNVFVSHNYYRMGYSSIEDLAWGFSGG